MKSVYCALRTGSLNKAVCASSLKGSQRISSVVVRIEFFEKESVGKWQWSALRNCQDILMGT